MSIGIADKAILLWLKERRADNRRRASLFCAWNLIFGLFFTPVHGEQQTPARDYGRDYQPERRDGNYDVDDNRADGAGALKNPADQVKTPDTVKPPVDRAKEHEDIRNYVQNYHKYISLQ